MRKSYRQPTNLVVVYWPRDDRWKAWDNTCVGVVGVGKTPEAALANLRERLMRAFTYPPEWVREEAV